MTQSRLRQAEIGVRRAFGSTIEMVYDGKLITLLAGAIRTISILFAYWGTDILFAQPYSVTRFLIPECATIYFPLCIVVLFY